MRFQKKFGLAVLLSARSKALRIPGSKKLLGLFGLAVSSVGAHVLMESIDGSRLGALYYRAGKLFSSLSTECLLWICDIAALVTHSCDKVSLFNDKVYLRLTLSHRLRF
jgi:hypothetical protein